MSEWKSIMLKDVSEEDMKPFLVKALGSRRVNEVSGPFMLEYAKNTIKGSEFKDWFYVYYFNNDTQKYVNRLQFYTSPKLKEKFSELVRSNKYKKYKEEK